MDMPMTLQDYIDKYGEASGTKRYNGVRKLLASRKKTYDSQPYTRFTKEWFIWKYPEDGIDRFNEHVNKSRQSEENMIKRWGEELGKKKWQETIAKKNTVALVRAQKGEIGVTNMSQKRKESLSKYWNDLSEAEQIEKRAAINAKSSATKKERYGSKTKLELYLEKYGEDGHIKYAEFLQNTFKSIGYSQEAETLIKNIIFDNPWLLDYTIYYRDSEDKTKCEWFLSSKEGVNFYDFCVKEAKAILEYDGLRWHPTEEQANELKSELMAITGLTYSQKYRKDQEKLKMAIDRGFKVFVLRSDFAEQQKSSIISQFINYIKEQLT
jgi:very-short-patch-repair endonuclease